MLLFIHKMLMIHKNKSFSYFFKEDKHTKLHEVDTHIKMHAAIALCIFISVVREISDSVHHNNEKIAAHQLSCLMKFSTYITGSHQEQ